MLSIFLFIVFFSFLSWLSYKPHRASDQHQRSIGAADATTGSSLTQVTAIVPDAFPETQKTALKPDYDNSIVQIIDNRTPIPQQPTSIAATEQLPIDMESATEREPELVRPNSQAPDELVQAARESAHSGDAVASDAAQISIQEGSVPELIRPLPPDPELVEAAIRDALEKSQDFSPLESADA